jgi:hypothetical protein
MDKEKEALNKLHTDASRVLGPIPGDGKIWLNSTGVVDKLIRAFTADMLTALAAKKDFMPWLEFEALRLNNLFLGRSPSDTYEIGPWNKPDQLGQHVLISLVINGETHLGVRDGFYWYTDKVMHLTKNNFDDAKLNQLIDGFKNILLGINSSGT